MARMPKDTERGYRGHRRIRTIRENEQGCDGYARALAFLRCGRTVVNMRDGKLASA